MRLHLLDLDGGVSLQQGLVLCYQPQVTPLREWGPRARLACRFGVFRRFEQELATRLASEAAPAKKGTGPLESQVPSPFSPAVTLYGSGDFHHVSLALVRRLKEP